MTSRSKVSAGVTLFISLADSESPGRTLMGQTYGRAVRAMPGRAGPRYRFSQTGQAGSNWFTATFRVYNFKKLKFDQKAHFNWINGRLTGFILTIYCIFVHISFAFCVCSYARFISAFSHEWTCSLVCSISWHQVWNSWFWKNGDVNPSWY